MWRARSPWRRRPRNRLAHAIVVDGDLHERPLTARQVARLLAVPLAAVYDCTRRAELPPERERRRALYLSRGSGERH